MSTFQSHQQQQQQQQQNPNASNAKRVQSYEEEDTWFAATFQIRQPKTEDYYRVTSKQKNTQL